MNRFKVFAVVHPYLNVIVSIFITMTLIVIAYAWGEVFQSSVLIQYVGQSIISLVSTLFFVFIIRRFGWLRASGFTSIGRRQAWLKILVIFIYILAINLCLTTGKSSFELSNPALIFWLGLSSLTAALFEETVFRGVVLFSFLWLWGYSKSGITKSIW
jgi:membrane protease YdiL (CAAX protease family)